MESIKDLVPQIKNLQNYLPEKSEPKNDLSIYKGELTAKCLVQSVATIKKAYPTLPLGFYDVLTDRIKANGFTDDRLRDAVNYVIDTCTYPTPTIANFISFDKKVKTYTYGQYVKLVEDGENGSHYKPVKLKDLPVLVWIHINDIAKYNIVSEKF